MYRTSNSKERPNLGGTERLQGRGEAEVGLLCGTLAENPVSAENKLGFSHQAVDLLWTEVRDLQYGNVPC